MAIESGIIYFKLTDRYDSGNTTYGNDVTKNCGLNGTEIDKNFHFLRGSDIESGMWNRETKKLVLKRVNGELIEIEGTNFSQVFSFSGSTFTPESGGTLSLTLNGSEPYLITGFTEACAEMIAKLEIACCCDEISALTEDFMTFTSEFYDFIVDVYLTNDEAIKNDIADLYERLEDSICDIRTELEREKENRENGDRILNNRINDLEQEYNAAIQAFAERMQSAFNTLDSRINRIIDNDIAELDRRINQAFSLIDSNEQRLENKIEKEKQARIKEDELIRQNIIERERDVKSLISIETENRRRGDESLDSKINRETTRLDSSLTSVRNQLSSERYARITGDTSLQNSIIRNRRELESLINNEAATRARIDNELIRGIGAGILTLEDSVEEAKRYAERLYIDDFTWNIPNSECDEIKWGVRIKDVVAENGEKRRLVVLNLNPSDKFLSQNCNYLSSTISLKYNENNNHIELLGNNREVASYIDADKFIQKGFLKNARVEIIEGEQILVLEWDGGDVTNISASTLFTQYIEGDGIQISGDTISIAIGDGEEFLGINNGKLYSIGIREALNNVMSAMTDGLASLVNDLSRLKEYIDSGLTSLNDEILEKLNTEYFNLYTGETYTIISELLSTVSALTQDVEERATKDDLDNVERRLTVVETSITDLITQFNTFADYEQRRTEETYSKKGHSHPEYATKEDLSGVTVDLSNYYTSAQTEAAIENALSGATFDKYATKEYVDEAIASIPLDDYATKVWVEEQGYLKGITNEEIEIRDNRENNRR